MRRPDREPHPFATEPTEGMMTAAIAALIALAVFASGSWCALRVIFGAPPPPPAEDRTR